MSRDTRACEADAALGAYEGADTVAEAPLGRVCVLGAGRTGFAVAAYAADLLGSRVDSVTLVGGANSVPTEESRELERRGVEVAYATQEVTGAYDLAVVSPGIPESSDFFEAGLTHARELIGEPEFAWRESPERWLGITGTNGKTTTTLLTTAMLEAGGLGAEAIGNVGVAATGAVSRRESGSWFVCELSSFQLATTRRFHPRAAALLNVTPDHLEWHGSMEAYAAAKEKVFANLGPCDLAVVSVDDAWCDGIAERLDGRGLRCCRVSVRQEPVGANAAFVRDDMLVVRLDNQEHMLARVDELSLAGEHNVQNCLTASALALELGVGEQEVRQTLATFVPLEHRIEPCGELGGVRFVNDSKATNVDSVAKALTAFDEGCVTVLLGGHDKQTDLSLLVDAVCGRCKAAVCFGEAGPRIADALANASVPSNLAVCEAPHLREALAEACRMAEPGDVVLLSPACSSFDEFGSYQERGRVFKRLVADYIAQADTEAR